jgi:hypothetical protein
MSVTAPISGSPAVAQAPPVAPLTAVPPGVAPAGAVPRPAPADFPVDAVSFSPAALHRLAMDAPLLPTQQLGQLLQTFGEIDAAARSLPPRRLGELATEIGTTADRLGAALQALPPGHAAPGHAAPGPGMRSSLADEPLSDAIAEADPALPVRAEAGIMLGNAAATLDRMQRRLDLHDAAPDPAAAAPWFDRVQDRTWCEAQIAAALAQVSRAARLAPGQEPEHTPRRSIAIAAITLWRGRIALVGPASRAIMRWLPVLLGAAAGWSALSRLDSGTARLLAAAGLVLGVLVWLWRRTRSFRRLRLELRH